MDALEKGDTEDVKKLNLARGAGLHATVSTVLSCLPVLHLTKPETDCPGLIRSWKLKEVGVSCAPWWVPPPSWHHVVPERAPCKEPSAFSAGANLPSFSNLSQRFLAIFFFFFFFAASCKITFCLSHTCFILASRGRHLAWEHLQRTRLQRRNFPLLLHLR